MRSPLFGGLIAAAAALSLPVQAQSLYSVNQICGARNTCYASVLNDAGAVAGSGFFYSPALGYLNFAEFASSMLIGARDINSSGYVVGASTVLGGGSYTFAFLYRPGDRFLHDLNPVFGWEAGGANSINDSNVIIGSGLLPGHSNFEVLPVFAAWPKVRMLKLTDSGQILANVVSTTPDGSQVEGPGLLFTPGAGVTTLEGAAIAINHKGQILERLTDRYILFTPGSGDSDLPAALHPVALNDNGDIVGFSGGTDTRANRALLYRSVLHESIDLNSVIDPASGWVLRDAVAVNNRGQILVYADSPAFATSVLLTPQP